MLQEKNKYYNWYHGYTQIRSTFTEYGDSRFYYNTKKYDRPGVFYPLMTSTTSATISTQHFGDKFDANNVETQIVYNINLRVLPFSIRYNKNVTLHIIIDNVLMQDLSTSMKDTTIGKEEITIGKEYFTNSRIEKSFKPPHIEPYFIIELKRKIAPEDLRSQKLTRMPGFKVTWYYSGIDVTPEAYFSTYVNTKSFVRCRSLA